jgi:hypothetical protein
MGSTRTYSVHTSPHASGLGETEPWIIRASAKHVARVRVGKGKLDFGMPLIATLPFRLTRLT